MFHKPGKLVRTRGVRSDLDSDFGLASWIPVPFDLTNSSPTLLAPRYIYVGIIHWTCDLINDIK